MGIKMNTKRKLKPIEDSKVMVAFDLGNFKDEFGRIHKKIKWVELDKEYNIGSSTKPDAKVYAIKFLVPEDTEAGNLGDIFKGLFK